MKIEITAECVVCNDCALECKIDAISNAGDIYVIDPETCVECGACVFVCDVAAITVATAPQTITSDSRC